MIYLNNLSPSLGSKKKPKRLGRGMGSGYGKTCGRGHKGQKSRSGCSLHRGFEGGQFPLYRRLPKFGFTSHKSIFNTEISLSDLSKISSNIITIDVLKKINIINARIKHVKIIASGIISKPVTIRGISVTKGALIAIKEAGGEIEDN